MKQLWIVALSLSMLFYQSTGFAQVTREYLGSGPIKYWDSQSV